jgi:hypothetical protein
MKVDSIIGSTCSILQVVCSHTYLYICNAALVGVQFNYGVAAVRLSINIPLWVLCENDSIQNTLDETGPMLCTKYIMLLFSPSCIDA